MRRSLLFVFILALGGAGLLARPAGAQHHASVNSFWMTTYGDLKDVAGQELERSVYLVQRNLSGVLEWHQAIGSALQETGRYVYKVPGGDTFTAGYRRLTDGGYDVYVTLAAPNGKVRWEKTSNVSRTYLNPTAPGLLDKYLKEWELSFAVGESVYTLVLTARPIPVTISTDAERQAELPAALALDQNYPNPFNPVTVIPYTLMEPGRVSLRVYDALGRSVRTLVDESQAAGTHTVHFDARDLPSGMYFYTLYTAKRQATRRMLLIR